MHGIAAQGAKTLHVFTFKLGFREFRRSEEDLLKPVECRGLACFIRSQHYIKAIVKDDLLVAKKTKGI